MAVPSFSENAELTSQHSRRERKEGYSSGEHGCVRGPTVKSLQVRQDDTI